MNMPQTPTQVTQSNVEQKSFTYCWKVCDPHKDEKATVCNCLFGFNFSPMGRLINCVFGT